MAKIISGLKCTRFHNSLPRFSWLNLIKKTNKWNKSGIQKYKNNKQNIITRCFPRKRKTIPAAGILIDSPREKSGYTSSAPKTKKKTDLFSV